MEDLAQLYLEHEKRITDNVPEIKHVDLWHEQISFMADEHPFKAPAVFFSYRTVSTSDKGLKIQDLRMQIGIYVYFETFSDTARNSKKQAKALEFLKMLTKINACFHGTSGETFTEMRRTAFNPVETGTANLLYLQSYEADVIDSSAQKLYVDMKFTNMEVDIEKIIAPQVPNGSNLYEPLD